MMLLVGRLRFYTNRPVLFLVGEKNNNKQLKSVLFNRQCASEIAYRKIDNKQTKQYPAPSTQHHQTGGMRCDCKTIIHLVWLW